MAKNKKKNRKKPHNRPAPSGKPHSSKQEQPKTTEVTCTGLTDDGKGIATWKGKRLEIPHLLPGEKAEVAVPKRGPAEVVRVTEKSEVRQEAPCPYFYVCGGCQIQHMTPLAQNDFKQSVVDRLMQPFGKPERIMTMEHPFDYRNKNTMTFGENRKRQIIGGLYAANSHDLIEIDRCLIHDPKADAIIATVKELLVSFKLRAYNEDTNRGFLRHVLIKTGKTSGEVMVVFVTGTPEFKGKNNFLKALRRDHPEISTIIQNINTRSDSMVLGKQEKVLFGKGYITDTIGGMEFEISAKSFYQINPVQTEKLYGKAVELAGLTGKETVIDAYCGIGTIGLLASKQAGKVIGVEMNKGAVKDAIRNSRHNKVTNARFYEGDAGKFMMKMAAEGKKADVVILDPPRSGSDEAFLSSVVKLGPGRVVYVSCNPETQVRDLHYLKKHGYKVKEIHPVDMFPQTYHVETAVLLEKSKR
ncbi:23S rRNA (uracil(1939)-C(5))-methyltransferase RlmD [Salimicrobium humidisoli]|uniref:23S rRNA (Uracil(1939)-C(5))-methyltransferase RlmD n=1 Tax=Salimicrobium humidisoli TaxID=2029857 RepID=A0ABX4HTG6_9BACI|nr:23S rRNA (uracil(1939)-C(5))-methyltransferase RlmD [Salimicrobium humidisoli]PBB06195.1 23S rRNA (uracil(1939)-C(5))-methyltransferase RlmD [Salimicrobium humidisoli]